MPLVLRTGRVEDGTRLQEIERLAGDRFRQVGRPEVADDEPASLAVLARYMAPERSWVALDDAGRPIGYVLVDDIDGNSHIEQVSVLPAHQGQGVGRALIERVQASASERGLPAVTLTAFIDVPWNAPLYRHLGFRVLPAEELGPQLRAVRDAETARGLDPATRVCMGLKLTT